MIRASLSRSRAREDYLDATDTAEIAEIADHYDTFNTWHRTRNALALATAAVWSYAVLDALVFGGPESQAFTVGPTVATDAVGLSVRVPF